MEIGQRVLRDHLELRAVLERLRGVIGAHPAPDDQLSGPPLGQELRSLSRMLDDHFAREEHGGYLSFVVERAPRLAHRVEQLGAQHGVLRARMRELIEMAEHPGRFAEVPRFAHALIDQIAAHEHAENDLIQASIYDDVEPTD